MKILLQSNIPKTSNYRKGLLSTLERMFHVKQYNLNVDIDSVLLDWKPDIYLSVKQLLKCNTVNILQQIGCKSIQLFPDDPDEIEKGLIMAKGYDYFFTNSMQTIKRYKENGIDAKVCCFAIDEKMVENVKPQDKYKCDIIFAGGDNKKRYRYTYLNALKGLDVKVYGKFQKDVYGKQNEILYDSNEYFSALKSAKIAIDFSVSGSGFMNVKSKTFEIAAAGSLIMANRFDEMENYFKYGVECVGFTTPENLRKLCEYYLENEFERLAIVQNGRYRFLKEHTWEKRIKSVFDLCGVGI